MRMTEKELQAYLLATYPKEDESCEWKEFKNLTHAFSGDKGNDIVSYVSALANMEGGHLVIGVRDKTLEVVGIHNFHDLTPENARFRILGKCTNLNSEGLQIEPLTSSDSGKTAWIIHVPKHKTRLPVYAHDKAWQRIDDNLVPLRPERLEAILAESVTVTDWSAQVAPDATLDDLEPEAILLARQKFREKNRDSKFADQIDAWDDLTFLDKAKVTIHGQITRTALLLLGKSESSHLLLPSLVQITWKLEGEERDYTHFGPPFLLNTSLVWQKIRNIEQKIFPNTQLLATKVSKYEHRVILEAMHNAIAHQDYTLRSRIIVTELIDRLIFENAGNFFAGKAEDYVEGTRTPDKYRNPWLAEAMANLGMIDTMGYGIHEMFLAQRRRYFPLPDYSKSEPNKVVLEIYGHVIDENYTRMLLEHQDLPLATVILLDRVQKQQSITDEAAAMLRRTGLLEGRKPNYFVAAQVAGVTDGKSEYIRNRAFDDAYYKDTILSCLLKFSSASRQELERLILDKLSDVLDEKQKKNKFRNILYAMSKRDKTIEKSGSRQVGPWVLTVSGRKLALDKLRQT
jgi:ATP-dependent DNA helicase RecG